VICGIFGISRQNYYKRAKSDLQRRELEEAALHRVREIRQNQPKSGTRKLWDMLAHKDSVCISIGRDHLHMLLRENRMLVKTSRSYKGGTNYRHRYRIYPNLLTGLSVTGILQVLVTDITYIRTWQGFAYLYLVTDYYSRRIVGHYVSDNLKSESAVTALKLALKRIPVTEGMIHHSDHGIQYCCDVYQSLLREKGILPSMTGRNRCYDNAIAERVNGILKNELGMNMMFPDYKTARQSARDAVRIYNEERLHVSLKYRTPSDVYEEMILAEATKQQSVLQVGASA
jgi:putative transposase